MRLDDKEKIEVEIGFKEEVLCEVFRFGCVSFLVVLGLGVWVLAF